LKKTLLRMALSAAAGLALLALLMVWGRVSPAQVLDTLLGLPPWVYLLCLGTHFVVYCLRSLRFLRLIPREQRPSFTAMMAVSASHNLASYVLPAKSGEATLVLYLRGVCRVSGAAGLASLIVSRLYDFAVMIGSLAVATLWLTTTPHWGTPIWLGRMGAGGLALLSATFLVLALRGEKVMGPLRLGLRTLRLDRTRLGRRVYELSQRASDALRVARGGTSPGALLALTVLIWVGIFVFYALLARGFGLPERIGFGEAVFGSSLAVMSNILPLNAFAGFGTQETGWVLGFGILGIDRESAFATGLAVHLVQLFNVCLMGLVGHLVMGALPRPVGASTRPAEEAGEGATEPPGPPSHVG
jgi:hypothetical protein